MSWLDRARAQANVGLERLPGKLGSAVRKGQVVCIVEAMKLMNEIETEADGKVVEILVKNGEHVEYGQKLIRLA